MAEKNHNSTLHSELSQAALDFYQLKQQPFPLNALGEYNLFFDSGFESLLDNIKHHLQFSDLILLVEGPNGSGKSSLLQQLLKTQLDNILLLPVIATEDDSLASIEEKVSPFFNESEAGLPLIEKLKNLQRFDQSSTLIIDDCQQLSDSCLQQIINFQQDLVNDAVHLHLLLLSSGSQTPRLEKLTQLQTGQLFIQHMPELTHKQTLALIQQCFKNAGSSQEIELNNNEISHILETAQGNFKTLMAEAASLLEKRSQQAQKNNTGFFKRSYLLPVSLIIVLISIFIFLQTEQTEFLPSEPAQLVPHHGAAIDNLPHQTIQPVTETANHQLSDTDKQADNKPATDKDNTEATDSAVIENIKNTQQDASIEPLLPVPEKTETTELIDSSQSSKIIQTIKAEQHAAVIQPVEKTGTEKKPAPEKIAIKSTQQQLTALKNLQQMHIANAEWLMQQNPNHWTLQILAARDPLTLIKFINRNQLGQDTAWYASELKGKPWYVLVHRLYSNRDTARQSISSLPAGLQQSHPWAKSIGSIQQAIKVP